MNQNPNDPTNPGAFNTQQAPPPGYQQPPPGAYQVPPGGMPYGYGGVQENLPNAGGVLTCGILSIVFSIGLIGLILGIVSISMASGAINKYRQAPGRYTEASFSRVKAGRTCGIIGLSLFPVWVLIFIAANA